MSKNGLLLQEVMYNTVTFLDGSMWRVVNSLGSFFPPSLFVAGIIRGHRDSFPFNRPLTGSVISIANYLQISKGEHIPEHKSHGSLNV